MKRVLIFSTAYLPFVGGAELAIKEITERLAGGYEFDMITARLARRLPRTERVGAVTVHRVGCGIPLLDKLWLPWGGAIKALELHARDQYDLFWCMMATYGSGAAYIADFFLRTRVPIALTLQEGDSERYLKRKWGGLVDLSWRFALARADVVTVISAYLGERAKRLGYAGEPVLIPNGVDAERFARPYPAEDIAAMRQRLGKKDGDIFLVTTSRLVEKNAVDDVIRALPQLPAHIQLIVYGIGPEEARLRALAKGLGVEARTRFMGQIGHEEMPLALKACNLFIRPSRSEGMGNSFIEAMAAGLPVIATQEGGIADFLFDAKRNPGKGATGWAVDKDAPSQIVTAVGDILAHPETVADVVARAKAMALKDYGWDLLAKRMGSVFDGLSLPTGMRLLLATPLYPPEIGGPATYAEALVEEFPKRGIEVGVLKFSDVRRWPNGIRQIAYCWRIYRDAKSADVILALDPVSVGWPSYFANLFLGKKLVVKIVGDHVWEQGTQRFGIEGSLDAFPVFSVRWHPYLWFLRALQLLVARHAIKVIVPSEYLKSIVRKWGVRPENISVIYNSISIGELGTVPKEVAELPRPLVVSAGRLVPWKNMEGVIDAVALLRSRGTHASLAILGDGPDKARLTAYATEALAGGFEFTGVLPHADLLATLGSADLFVLNSSYEGLSHVLIEAALLGVPSVATVAGGNGEVLASSALVPPGDPAALAAHLADALTRPGAYHAGNLERFARDTMINKTRDLLRNL